MNIILASASPRRTEILKENNIKHKVVPSTIKEIVDYTKTKEEIVKSLAYQKAKDVSDQYPEDLIIGADTIVVIDNEILGKPKDEQDAIRMLSKLANNTHEVITGVAIITKDQTDIFAETSKVTFKQMTKAEILEYIHKENVYDKAGSYAIQSKHANFIKQVEGDYYNIVGLPINALKTHLSKFDN